MVYLGCWIVTLDVLKSYNSTIFPQSNTRWIVTLDVLKYGIAPLVCEEYLSWIVTLDVLKYAIRNSASVNYKVE